MKERKRNDRLTTKQKKHKGVRGQKNRAGKNRALERGHVKVESVISIGYPAEKKAGIPKEKLSGNKIKINTYGQK